MEKDNDLKEKILNATNMGYRVEIHAIGMFLC